MEGKRKKTNNVAIGAVGADSRKKPYSRLQVREGFCAPGREGEWSVENIKRKKKDEPEKKKEKRALSVGCGTMHPRTRRAASCPRTRQERGPKGGVSQSEVREGAPFRARARPRAR